MQCRISQKAALRAGVSATGNIGLRSSKSQVWAEDMHAVIFFHINKVLSAVVFYHITKNDVLWLVLPDKQQEIDAYFES